MKIKFIFICNFGLLLFLSLYSCTETEIITSGLEGVIYKGPINPLEIIGQDNNLPFEALFHVYTLKRNQFIKSFSSNLEGRYKVLLNPGTYKIIADGTAPIMQPEFQIKEVTVNFDEIIVQDLYFDTGIR